MNYLGKGHKARRKIQEISASDRPSFSYHKNIFDNYEPLKFDVEKGEWQRTNIIRNTRFINIEKDLKKRMKVKGRFPIPDPIKKTEDHQINDENIILRADSLIESAYDTEKGDEFVKNEDFIIPGILSPLQSEISMNKVDLYSSSEDDQYNEYSMKPNNEAQESSSKSKNFAVLIFIERKDSFLSACSNKQSESRPEDHDIQHTKSGFSTKHNFETDSKLAENSQNGKLSSFKSLF